MYYTYLATPIGQLTLVGKDEHLFHIHFPNSKHPMTIPPAWQKNKQKFAIVAKQITEYFAGMRKTFNIPLKLAGTDFQKRVWETLQNIPYGKTISYGELAKEIGNPKASRAVGGANAVNPIPIIIPCHRVIGADKSLTGFGGGLETKQFLLRLEQS